MNYSGGYAIIDAGGITFEGNNVPIKLNYDLISSKLKTDKIIVLSNFNIKIPSEFSFYNVTSVSEAIGYNADGSMGAIFNIARFGYIILMIKNNEATITYFTE